MNVRLWTLVLVLCVVSALSGGCLDDKVVELVATGETSVDFSQNETTEQWTEDAVLDVGQQVRDILEDNGYDESDIKGAHMTSVHYGVTSFDQAHDWTISGAILVSRDGGPFVEIMNYTSQSVQAALNKKLPAKLESGGVDLVNKALDDFVEGQNPVLTFRISNATAAPTPNDGDPMIFDWRAWLAIQVILEQEVSIPDPF